MKYLLLLVAILAEVTATSALNASNGFTKLIPSSIVVVGYGVAFYCLSLTLKSIPLGIAYAIWSGLGVVLTAIVGLLLFKQKLDVAAIAGLSLIVIGVIVLNVFSKSAVH
ncbi:small multidrug resistance pump [Chitinophaga sp. YR573]|uniref:DMT family transporter n=1 Tax=Chitinophaga sp. YR573 TaxID=1881040 RepID=UPI0008C329D0|nr:multidrug efflux SMR transporter [Chitinophaga sp. YR573]SEW35279.1 small multidrug resistance pump [Chitinophaga sp. YR573]